MTEPTTPPAAVTEPEDKKEVVDKKKPKLVVDVEKSQKETVQNSTLGKLILSDHVCVDCGTPVLAQEWTSCVKCGGTKAVEKSKYKPKTEKVEKPKKGQK